MNDDTSKPHSQGTTLKAVIGRVLGNDDTYSLCRVWSLWRSVVIWFSFGGVTFKWYKRDTKIRTLALKGTPAENISITCLCPCLRRCSAKNEVRNWVFLLKETSPKENQMMTLFHKGFSAKFGKGPNATLQVSCFIEYKYQQWHCKTPFSGDDSETVIEQFLGKRWLPGEINLCDQKVTAPPNFGRFWVVFEEKSQIWPWTQLFTKLFTMAMQKLEEKWQQHDEQNLIAIYRRWESNPRRGTQEPSYDGSLIPLGYWSTYRIR